MNLFSLPAELPDEEVFEPLTDDNGILIERIISKGQVSPDGFWYDQERDEWVVLLQGRAEIRYLDDRRVLLKPGDWLLIPAREKHRVESTSQDPPCIWLAVHGKIASSK